VAFLAQFGGFDAGSLELLQRILLISDGTLTDTLEAAFREPICLRKISHEIHPARSPVDELDLPHGEMVMQRQILLCGSSSGRTYVYADSLLAVDRLPPRFREELLESNVPMGRLWSEHRLETWKELLAVARHPMGKLAQHFQTAADRDCLVRRYRVFSSGRPLMSITEHFPASY
jgi:chorismate-pyruvate lyase